MTKYKITLHYAGTRYAGWQIQKGQQTIQGCLKDALQSLTRESVSVVGAGRTDSGAHAMKQTAHFSLATKMQTRKLWKALNALLPWDIRVVGIQSVSPEFHARRDARKKQYQYRIYNGPVLSPFLRGYVHHVIATLDLEAMRESARQLCGSHDFSSFTAAAATARTRTRTVFLSRVQKRGHHIRYQIEGDGFLHHMVRNIVGTLLEIGLHRRAPEDITRILNSKDRTMAGPTAPPHGLYLIRVFYN